MLSVSSNRKSPNSPPGDRQRHRQHDHDRVDEALELRRQHQEHDHQREAEREHDRAGGLLELPRRAGVVDA